MSEILFEKMKQEELSRWKQDGLVSYADIIRSKHRFDYGGLKRFVEKCVDYMNEYRKFTYDWNEDYLIFDPILKTAKLEYPVSTDISFTSSYQLESFYIPLKYGKDIKWVTRSFKELKKLFNPEELGKLLLNLKMPESLENDVFFLNFIIKQKGILSLWFQLSHFIFNSYERLTAVGRGKTKEEAKRNYTHLKQYFT